MQTKKLSATIIKSVLAGCLLFSGASNAAEIYLRAEAYDKILPDAETASMWGFASCTDITFSTCTVASPGPQINVSTNETLNIHLMNTLPIPVSVVIPGQDGGGNPVMMTDGLNRQRVQSFTHEALPNAIADYSWSAMRSGTYLYQSGTLPSIQVPMGLYGAVVVHEGASYSDSVLASAPNHYYRMNNPASGTVIDAGAGNVNATVGVAVTSGQLGYSSDKAADFDTTDINSFIDTGVTSLASDAFSIEAWVNPNSVDGSNRIVAKDEIGVRGQFILWFRNGQLRFQVAQAGGNWRRVNAPTTPTAGSTYHVVGVFDGTDIVLYVDGVEVARNAFNATSSNTNSLPITIGADSDIVGNRGHIFDGTIDEVAIYESALSSAQILSHFEANGAESVMLLSEIDLLQNQRVNDAANAGAILTQCTSLVDYALTADGGYPCTVDYNPLILLVNGESSGNLRIGNPGGEATLRLLNAGLKPHSPSIVGLEFGLIAEDGNPYPGLPRLHSSALLAPGKTLDAVVSMPEFEADGVTPANASVALYDRMPAFSLPEENSLATLQIGSGSFVSTVAPTVFAVDDSYAVTEDTTLTATASVLTNDAGLTGATVAIAGSPMNGSIVLQSDGTFDYTPNENFSGTDTFSYNATLGSDSYPATVILSVSFANDTPVGADDNYSNNVGSDITVDAPGILANDADIDGDVLTAQIEGTLPAGLVLNADGSFTYSGASTSFTYRAIDTGALQSDPITVTLNVNAVSNIALTVVDQTGTLLTDDYRWVVEEDTNWHPNPEIAPPLETLATSFHKSYMPIFAQGVGSAEFAQLALDPNKHYFVSVLPSDAGTGEGHTIGGAQIAPGVAEVLVTANKQPLPYAQISIFVFEDSSPTNGAVDGAENDKGLGGFQVTIEDGGGRYGIAAGTMSQDADGNPLTNGIDCFGDSPAPVGVILTCPDTPENVAAGLVGEVLVKNLFPGKFGVIVTPPPGPENWIQTSTIEGTKVIDTWVKAGEPEFFQEFGPGGWHAFVGFVNPANLVLPEGGTNTVTGKVTNLHMSRPPNQLLVDSDSNDSLAHTRSWVGLNSVGGIGPNVAVVQANEDGTFSLPNIPDGLYQLVVWDAYLDQVIAYRGVSLPDGADVGNMPVFQWFTRSEHHVFLDENQNGVRDEGELPISEQAVNLRWRDGTVNQSFPTDLEGYVPFDQTFPFFHWQVLEVDFARFKATGLTVSVDNGGDVSTGPHPGVMSPQVQGPCTQDDVDNSWNGCTNVGDPYANPDQRTETGPVLTQGFQGFLGQTSVFEWGKAPYAQGENGGISGIVYYSSTRAENDPRLAVGEPWEPGVPSVTIRLYREVETSDGGTALALVQETQTDNWDESLPEGCPGADAIDSVITGGVADKCYDGLRNFNQARPAVFDGGYAFMDIPPGKYVVEMIPPVGYDLLKEEDNNVAYGDVFANVPAAVVLANGVTLFSLIPDPATVVASLAAEPGLAQPRCVGTDRIVPDFLTLFPSENAEAPFAGADRPLCDRKEVILSDQGQSAADFFLFTGTPIAAHFVGMILDDVAQEFNPYSPQFGEKWAPPFVPVSIRDYKGAEISRVYSDQWGRMNGLVPSTFTANMPSPSGFSPAMLMTCMNDPGPIIDNRSGSETFGESIIDPQYNPAYSNFCYTFQYMPGTTTYLDTPVLPVSAFASGYNPVDCAVDEGTPMIRQVDGTSFGPLVTPGGTITITSQGEAVNVSNPDYEGPMATGLAGQKTIQRNYGFGDAQGVGTVTVGGQDLVITSWSANSIVAVAPNVETVGQLVVTRDNGNETEHSITITVSNDSVIRVANGGSIQTAIDSASPGDLIIVEPGTYNELVIMWQPVRLQGSGAGSTLINGVKRPTELLVAWREKMDCVYGLNAGCTHDADVLPTQAEGAIGFESEEGAAITVVGISDSNSANSYARNGNTSRIDGFSVTGGDTGGGIFVNGFAHGLEISNNHVFGNNGLYGGGIRIGRPFLELEGDGPFGFNQDINLHNNTINQNGGLGGAGGGLSILAGTDNYSVTNNNICGNFTTGDGGGIGHLGLSDGGVIANNNILFNQSFSQATTRSGGGILVSGDIPRAGNLTLGSGSVTIESNTIQGNQAGAGHGGGIRTQFINGQDISDSVNPRTGRANVGLWHLITIQNNMINNNIAGWSGGGISLQDTARGLVVNNTVVHNDSTATVAATFTTGNPNISANQPAGISSEPHSTALNTLIVDVANRARYRDFSNPILSNNIIWQNRSFHYDGTLADGAALDPILEQTFLGECVASSNYSDLGVLAVGFQLDPRSSVLTDTTGYNGSNTSNDPGLVNPYCNGGRIHLDAPGAFFALPALDEGGATWIDLRYGPLTTVGLNGVSEWDYHIEAPSSAIDSGTSNRAPATDFDNQPRPSGTGFDIGADEVSSAPGIGGTVTYTSGAFGNVDLNQTASITVTASVTGAPVTFVSSSNLTAPFAKTADTCSGLVIANGSTCSYTVTYTPTFEQTDSAILEIDNDNFDGSPQVINLSGTGVVPPGIVSFTSVTPYTLDRNNTRLFFGDVEDGVQEATVTITVADYPVTFGSLQVLGARYSMSTEDDGDLCSNQTLSAGDTCTVTIIFNPNNNRPRSGRLNVPSDAVSNVRLDLAGR
ncbi:MAG: hypothetical protein COA86_10815 [Kangiella sp.]|nr:MAG: hypothetical protein COA86_10815 [Kangiella sp.]